MQKILTKINKGLAEIGGGLMTLMMVLFLANIISREINRPVQGLLQMAVFAMIILIYLGLAHCEEKDEHVRLEVIMTRLPQKIRYKLRFLCSLVELLVVSIALYAVTKDTWAAFVNKACITGTKPMLLWPVKSLMVVGLSIFWLQLLSSACKFFRKSNCV